MNTAKNKCHKCFRTFSTKFNLQRHIDRDKNCENDILISGMNIPLNKKINLLYTDLILKNMEKYYKKFNNIDAEKIRKNQCNWCLKTFSSHSYYIKHNTDLVCNNYNDYNKYKKIIIDLLKDNEINVESVFDEANKKIEIKENPRKQKKDNGIKLVSFGNENINDLTDDEQAEILYKGHLYNKNIIKYLYTNSRLPQYHTLLITNLKSKFGKYFYNNEWLIKDIDELTTDIRNNNRIILGKIMKNRARLQEKYKYHTTIKLTDLMLENTMDYINNNPDKEQSKSYNKTIKELLYTYSVVIKNTKNNKISTVVDDAIKLSKLTVSETPVKNQNIEKETDLINSISPVVSNIQHPDTTNQNIEKETEETKEILDNSYYYINHSQEKLEDKSEKKIRDDLIDKALNQPYDNTAQRLKEELIDKVLSQPYDKTIKTLKEELIDKAFSEPFDNTAQKQKEELVDRVMDLLKEPLKESIKEPETNDNKHVYFKNEIVAFGDENIDDLTPQEINNVLSYTDKYFMTLLTTLHFNKRFPQYNNLYMTDIRSENIKIYRGNSKWETVKYEQGIKEIIIKDTEKLKKLYDNKTVEKVSTCEFDVTTTILFIDKYLLDYNNFLNNSEQYYIKRILVDNYKMVKSTKVKFNNAKN